MQGKNVLRIAALMVAGTLGAGIFGLPYIFVMSGWMLAGAYLVVFAAVLAWVHSLYSRTLIATGGEHRLLGLVGHFYGWKTSVFATVAILGGLLLVLLIYLVLVGHFFALFLNGSAYWAVLLFWFSASFAAMFATRRLAAAETIGVCIVGALIVYVFLSGIGGYGGQLTEWNPEGILLPFASVLFALAGWATVESLTEFGKGRGLSAGKIALGIAIGGICTVVLYVLFVLGIVGSAPSITPDTIQGLAKWPLWRIFPVAALGIFGLWTVYVIIAFEIRKSFEADLRWPRFLSVLPPLLVPPVLLLFGLKDFFQIIGLVGGIFVAIQYVFIIFVSKKVLQPGAAKSFLLDMLVGLFLLAAVYEVWHFIVG